MGKAIAVMIGLVLVFGFVWFMGYSMGRSSVSSPYTAALLTEVVGHGR